MRLHVEISARSGNWDDDKLRRRMKVEIAGAVSDAINDLPYAELNSLTFRKPSTRKPKAEA